MYQPKPLTPFEQLVLDNITKTGQVFRSEKKMPAYGNARGYRFTSGDKAVLDADILGYKYGVSLAGTGNVLIKNFVFCERRSNDMYGSGILLEAGIPTVGPTYISNAWVDLHHTRAIADYKIANNEAIDIEPKQGLINIRESVLINGEDAGIDSKSSYNIDSTFIASGHRALRQWQSNIIMANSVVLAHPGGKIFWGSGPSVFSYYNCKFGEIGQAYEDLVDTLPESYIDRDISLGRVDVIKLAADPFPRGLTDFFTPGVLDIPEGFLKPAKSKERTFIEKLIDLINLSKGL